MSYIKCDFVFQNEIGTCSLRSSVNAKLYVPPQKPIIRFAIIEKPTVVLEKYQVLRLQNLF